MSSLRVFIASSTEGAPVAQILRTVLQQELGALAAVELWSHKFGFSDTNIESLEKIGAEADLAIVLLTPDDKTTSRHNERASPRDNLVFELGLFIGTLGRERTVVAKPADGKAMPLKLPSDILGITALEFDPSTPEALKTSLQTRCVKLADHIRTLGPRSKWTALQRQAQQRNAEFIAAITGTWWERIDFPEGSRLSFFTISADPNSGQVLLDGQSYDAGGKQSAWWKSEMLRCYPDDRRLTYLWRGGHPLPEQSHLKFHGYGSFEFRGNADAAGRLLAAGGDFWDVDEANPALTLHKPVSLRRATEREAEKMDTGSSDDIRTVVLKRLKDW